MLEDSANSLQIHSLHVWVEEHNEQPSDEADAAIEAKSTTRGDPFHHREERRRNDDVRRPASDGVEHGSQSADFKGDELGANPRDCCHSRGKKCNVEDDCHKDCGMISMNCRLKPFSKLTKNTPRSSAVAYQLKGGSVDGDEIESNRSDEHADGHAQNCHA